MKNSPPSRWLGIAIGVVIATALFWRGTPERVIPPVAVRAAPNRPIARPVLVRGLVPGAKSGRPWEDVAGWDRLAPRERIVTLLSKRFALETRGAVETLEVARDELFVPGEGVRQIAEQGDVDSLMRHAEALRGVGGMMAHLILYPEGARRDETSRRILTGRLLLHTGNVSETVKAATAMGCERVQAIDGLPGYVVAHDLRMPGASLLSAAELTGKAAIDSAVPLLGGWLRKASQPTKATYFKEQWHLQNTGQHQAHPGIDVNVVPVWNGVLGNGPLDSGYRGKGVLIGFVDDCLESTHSDLSPHYDHSASLPLVGQLLPGTELSAENYHGTCVAGLAAASGIGASGVAPEASITGIWMVPPIGYPEDEAMEAQAFVHKNDVIQVKNNSWGKRLYRNMLGTVGPAVLEALDTATKTGRDGKGEVLVFAAGNEYDVSQLQGNKSGFSNNFHVLAVSAVSARGKRSAYSQFGPHLIACAPSGGTVYEPIPKLATTDRSGDFGYNEGGHPYMDVVSSLYTKNFDGTSAAAGISSGVIALILEANPNLGWRDVKEVLLRSGAKVDAADADWVSRDGGRPSLPPIKHNHQYGGGLVNASNAVALAKQWRNLDPMLMHSITNSEHWPIPDNSQVGVTTNFPFVTGTPLRVEAVEVIVDMRHTERGTVTIDLQSPSGTISHLAYFDADDAPDIYHADDDSGYRYWTFSTSRHWGESSHGTWKVIFRDLSGGQTGSVEDVTVRLHGVSAPPAVIDVLASTHDTIFPMGAEADLHVAVGGLADHVVQWLKGVTPFASGSNETLRLGKMTQAATGTYTAKAFNLTNVTGTSGVVINVGAVDTRDRSVTVNEWGPLVLRATAAGPGIKYQWMRDGSAIGDSAGLTGTNTPVLAMASVARGDADGYSCQVTVGSATVSTGVFDVQVRVKPAIAPFEFDHTIVSDTVAILVPIVETASGVDGLPTRFSITGLPSGLTYNPVTGWITGRPNVGAAKPYSVTVTASNAAGVSSITRLLTIDPPAPTTVGTFTGLVEPDVAGNKGLGGNISVTCSSSGVFSGRLSLGPVTYPLAGRLDVKVATDPKGTMLIKRAGRIDPLELSFWISKTDGHLTGSVRDVTAPFLTTLDGWQNPYSTARPAGGIAATYNAWIDAPPSESPPPAGTVPEGTTCGVLQVSALGGTTWQGRMGDGTLVVGSSKISANGSVPVHMLLYGGTGSLHGWAQATDVPSPGLNTLGGSLLWVKLQQPATSRNYKGGFVVNDMVMTGGQYVGPPVGTVLWGMGTKAGAANASLLFAKGGLEAAANYADLKAKAVRISTSHYALALSPNPTVLVMSIRSASGWFWGTATIKDTVPANVVRTLEYVGLTCPGFQKGRGYFLVPQLPNPTTSPLLSGSIELVAP